MPIYGIIILFLIIIVFLNLLSNPIVWVIIGGLVLWSQVKKVLFAKQIDEYNRQFQQQTQQKKEHYYGRSQSTNDDVIDVNYTEVEQGE